MDVNTDDQKETGHNQVKLSDCHPEMSHIMKPPEPKCPHFPLLHHAIAVRTTTATMADVKKTRHMS